MGKLKATIGVVELRQAIKDAVENVFADSDISESVYMKMVNEIEDSFTWRESDKPLCDDCQEFSCDGCPYKDRRWHYEH